MARSTQPDKGNSRKTNKTGRHSDDTDTARLPVLQAGVDAFCADLPKDDDDKPGGKR